MTVIARAHPNIALIKYWGKRDAALNLPAVSSMSVTLAGLSTTTRVRWASGEHRITLNGAPAGPSERQRIVEMVQRMSALAGVREPVEVDSENDFPTAAGLASSASGFAALGMALRELMSIPLSLQGLSAEVRRGSGSAARSLHGGFVEWRRGVEPDGSDSVAVPLAPASWWDIRVLVAVLARGPKDVGSRDGMAQTALTSPMYEAWLRGQDADMAHARDALALRDLSALGPLAEASCLKMVSTWLTTAPPLHYWQPQTLQVVQAVSRWRNDGLPIYFTTDAGPHVKVICDAQTAPEAEARLRALGPVLDVLSCPVGGPATVEVLP